MLDFSQSRDEVVAALLSLVAGGGGNTPESVYSGVMAALVPRPDHLGNMLGAWRREAKHSILVLGDAPPNTPEPVTGYTQQIVIAAAAALGVSGATTTNGGAVIYTLQIGSDAATRASFEALSSTTGGQSFTASDANSVVPVLLNVLGVIGEQPDSGNKPPMTLWATPSIARLEPPDLRLVEVSILNVTDPEGQPVAIEITGITQDEPISTRRQQVPDATGVGTASAWLRAERAGHGSSRVYHVTFVARDTLGAESTGFVRVCVPHDQRENVACDDNGQEYESTRP